jgi:hypothetical protein
VTRNKGDKDYSQREKQMMISLINDYSLFGATDDEMIKMLSKKIGKENNEKISETLFYRLKKEAKKKRGDSEQWLDYYAKYQYVEYYRNRMEELELVQKKLLKILIEETEKSEENKDKSIINHLSKTIADNSKVLFDFGVAPPVLSYIKSVISENYFNSHGNNDNKVNEEINTIKNNLKNVESAFYLKVDNNEITPIEYSDDPNRVF